MCGRYDNLIAAEAYRRLFRPARMPESNFPPRYNVAPTDQVPIIRVDPRNGERELVIARWGLVPWWSKELPKVPHINARCETVDQKPMFREAFAKRRALIPATGFFEWQKRADGKQPYRFRRKDLDPFAFAGLWEFCRMGGKEIVSAAIIVGAPNPLVEPVHDRMPVILAPEGYHRWLDPEASAEELKALLKPCPEDAFELFPVSRVVNSVRNDTEECVAPLDPAAPEGLTTVGMKAGSGDA
jgi:putative SOS response-associated peptidase YedK